MRIALVTLVLLAACGTTSAPEPSVATVAPAAPPATTTVAAIDAAVPASSPLDALVAWVVTHDVESLRVEVAGHLVGVTSTDDGAICTHGDCYAMPSAAAIRFVTDRSVIVAMRAEPELDTTGTLSFTDDRATFTAQTTSAHVRPIGARPPAPTRRARGRTVLAHRDAAPIEGLDDALAPLGNIVDIDVQTLHAGSSRITLVRAVGYDEGGRSALLVRASGGVARSDDRLGSTTALVEVTGAGLEGAFTVVRVSDAADRGWTSRLWSVTTDGTHVHVESVSLGGADGYGEGCENESDGYCVWLTACERALVVDDRAHAHLGPPITWSAEHRRLSDRWIYGEPEEEPECPSASLRVTPTGLVHDG